MERLVPDEPVTHYQIGTILKAQGNAGATKEFETARNLNPRLAAPHFQLYNLYRQLNRTDDAASELRTFQDLKKQQEGAAVPEDMEWSWYAEIYDPIDGPVEKLSAASYRAERVGRDLQGVIGMAAISLDGRPRPSLLVWSPQRVAVYRNGITPIAGTGLETLRDVVSIAVGDFDNDGLPDLCVVTAHGAALYRNVNGKFQKHADLASGSFRQAIWIDYDHDYDLDLLLLGDDSKLLRNNGAAGFSDETKRFPFVPGRALSATRFDLEPDTPGFDLIISYQNRTGVLYHDRLAGSYEAVPIASLPAGVRNLTARDLNRDGRTDLIADGRHLLNKPAGMEPESGGASDPQPSVAADFSDSGRLTRVRLGSNGEVFLDRDTSSDYGNWIEVALTGVKNLKTGIGTKVEVKAGASYEKQTYDGIPLV